MSRLPEPPSETQVLIAGGGPTGLSAAEELSLHGIETVVVEPRTYVSHTNPRAKLTNVRTMEHFRRWGVANRIREAANLPIGWSQEVVFCTGLLGDELARFDNVFGMHPSDTYGEPAQQIPQFLTEDTLREVVREDPNVTLVTGWRADSLEQDEDGVTVTVESTVERMSVSHGDTREIRADYLLGCDGVRSTVREAIGSSYQGDANPRQNLGVVFRAPYLAERHGHGPAVHYWTLTPNVQGFMGRLDLDDRWWLIAVGVDDVDVDPRSLVFEMVGDEFEMTVLTTDPWSAKMLLVDEAQDGRVFLVGDAAHLNPPWGGHGYNTGVGDAVDIGWKLGAVLNGWADPALLETYQEERRTVHQEVIDVSTENMQSSPADLVSDHVDDVDDAIDPSAYDELRAEIYEKKKLEFHSLGMVLGYRYDDSPAIVDDGTVAPPVSQTEHVQTSYPGARLPHCWLDREGDHSIYDELGTGLSLLRLDADVPVDDFRVAATELGIPLDIVTLRGEQLSHDFSEPLLLVRPDQHVAWRGSAVPEDAEGVLTTVCGFSLEAS